MQHNLNLNLRRPLLMVPQKDNKGIVLESQKKSVTCGSPLMMSV